MNRTFSIAAGLLGLVGGAALAQSNAQLQGVSVWRFQGGALSSRARAKSVRVQPGDSTLVASAPKAEWEGSKGSPVHLSADHLTVLAHQHRGIWKGHVQAIWPGRDGRPKARLTCDRLVTELSESQRIARANCTGHVELSQGDRRGWGEKAVYDDTTRTVVVTGNLHGEQGSSRFRGQKLTLFIDTSQIEIDRPVLEAPGPQELAVQKSEAAR